MFSKQSQGLKKRGVVCALSLAAPTPSSVCLPTLQLVLPQLGASGLCGKRIKFLPFVPFS